MAIATWIQMVWTSGLERTLSLSSAKGTCAFNQRESLVISFMVDVVLLQIKYEIN